MKDRLLSRTESLVHKYPEDLSYRALRGSFLCLEGDYKHAIPELQRALKNSALKPLMLLFLSECYSNRHMDDFSIKQLEELLEELPDTTQGEL